MKTETTTKNRRGSSPPDKGPAQEKLTQPVGTSESSSTLKSQPTTTASANIPQEADTIVSITGINRDKTRRITGPGVRYQVYFELSGSPGRAWRALFDTEWVAAGRAEPEGRLDACVDRNFLVAYCTLEQIGNPLLPLLKKAVAATNVAYSAHLIVESEKERVAARVWTDERAELDRVADGLDFTA